MPDAVPDAVPDAGPTPATPHETHREHHLLALLGSLLAGVLGSVQGRMNGELSRRTGEPVEAAVWSFGSGLLVLTVVVLTVPAVRAGLGAVVAAVRSGRLRWWQGIGGLAGGLYVAVQSYAVPLVGVALFSVAVVAGQVGNALVVDRFGIGPGGPTPVAPGRVAAAGLAVVGVALSVSGRLDGSGLVLLPVLLALAAGAGAAAQAGVNGRVNHVSRHVLSTTWLNFTMGTAMLGVVAAGRWAAGGLHPSVPHDVPWWAWLGGLCGIAFIGTAAWAVRHLGVLLFSLAVVTGQLTAAVVLDLLDPATRPDVGVPVLAGVGVTLVAAVLAARYARPSRA